MDIERAFPNRRRRRTIFGLAGAVAVVAVTVGLAQLEPAAPVAETDALWIATVERGEMLRQVRGPGTLVPENLQWIAAGSEGRVVRVLTEPGTPVDAETVVLELSNPELAQQAQEAEMELRAAEADYQNLEAQLESEVLSQEAELARASADFQEARLEVEANERLAAEGLLPEIELRRSRLRAEQLETRHQVELRRLETSRKSAAAQLASRRTRLDQLRELAELRRGQREALRVEAGMSGVLQEMRVEVGQQVAAGAILARVAQPGSLRAELRIPEIQARDLQIGQKAAIDTRNGIVEGRVARIDPAVREGSVTVDVTLEGELPRGARPDLSVDGTIEIERLEDTLYVGRPAYGRAHQRITLFRLDKDEDEARRVEVLLGRSSVSTVEIVEGLEEGDRVILSDTSEWDDVDRLRLN